MEPTATATQTAKGVIMEPTATATQTAKEVIREPTATATQTAKEIIEVLPTPRPQKEIIEALVVIVPDPDLITLNYPNFADAVSRVNTTLANAYTLTCDESVDPLYVNPTAVGETPREILTATGEYALQDSEWKPTYIATDACPSVIIRLWFEREVATATSRQLRGGITQDDQIQIVQGIRNDVVPKLQSGQYKIIIWMNGQQTPVESIRVVNLEQAEEEQALAANGAPDMSPTKDIELFGGIGAGVALVGIVVAVFVVRRVMRREKKKDKRTLKEASVEILDSRNPMTLLQAYHPRLSVAERARRLSGSGVAGGVTSTLHPGAIRLDISPMENPLKQAAATAAQNRHTFLPIDMSPRAIDPQHFTKVKKTFAGQLARPTEVVAPQGQDRTPVTERLSMRPARSMVTAASLDVNPMAAYKNREMFNAMHSRNGRRLAAKVTGQKPTIE